MSAQRFRLHRSVAVAAALLLAFALASPSPSSAAPQRPATASLSLSTPDPATALLQIWAKLTSGLRSVFQAADEPPTGDPGPNAVDPWDDDLGKKPPQ
jgi:hypothetical protein